jgi:hypothetical protein
MAACPIFLAGSIATANTCLRARQPSGSRPHCLVNPVDAVRGYPSTRAAHGQHTGSTRAAHGQHTGSTRAAHGQHTGSTRAAHGQHTRSTLIGANDSMQPAWLRSRCCCRSGTSTGSQALPAGEWKTAEMESGRTVHVTLHRCPAPGAAPGAQQQEAEDGGGPLRMVLCNALLPDGSTRVRVLLFGDQVSCRGPSHVQVHAAPWQQDLTLAVLLLVDWQASEAAGRVGVQSCQLLWRRGKGGSWSAPGLAMA